ncbi:MAG: hypothetical protein GX934_05505 [Burkholderiales bacterium]|jgi:hypothetical protein|nr:hypothetical protein [Burkholderiales bacterium]
MAYDDPINEIGANKPAIRGTEVAGAQYAAEASKIQAPAAASAQPKEEAVKGIDQTDKFAISEEAQGLSAQTPQSAQKVQGPSEGGESKMADAQKGLEATLAELQAEREGQKQAGQ